ncbi:unnamed protein product [Haemonchus placei]|uniref:Uncharacterized protein n=1 Tax=Haemonchus placei TaxID=6290 RepID=A0A0N4VYN9_HAEPC|nr:unnamed protein product [Haemonchus placei]
MLHHHLDQEMLAITHTINKEVTLKEVATNNLEDTPIIHHKVDILHQEDIHQGVILLKQAILKEVHLECHNQEAQEAINPIKVHHHLLDSIPVTQINQLNHILHQVEWEDILLNQVVILHHNKATSRQPASMVRAIQHQLLHIKWGSISQVRLFPDQIYNF